MADGFVAAQLPDMTKHIEHSSETRSWNLNDLCLEIQLNIAKHIFRPSDLKSLCLTSKRLYAAAVEVLYHTISLEVGKRTDLRLSAMLHPGNAGLKSIRILRIRFEARERETSDSDNSRAQTVVRMLVEFLPANILEDFERSPWLALDQETFLLLLDRQKRLQWLTALRLDAPDIVEKLKQKTTDHADLYKNCLKLAIYPESLTTLELGQFFLSNVSKLTELIIHPNFSLGSMHYSPRELNDGPTGPGLVTRTLFSHLLPFNNSSKSQAAFAHLTILRLAEVSLRHCADTFGKLVNFSQIEGLRVVKCPGADALLSMLCKSNHLPKKLRCLEFQHQDNADNDALTALDDFLCLVEGIEDLYVDLTNVKAIPSVDGIVKHGKTLEVLLVHASDNSHEEHTWPPDEFQRLCLGVTKLQQISCAWPPTSVLRADSPSWDSYHYAIHRLHYLITLHITTFPTCTPLKANLEKSKYTTLLRALSTQLFTSTNNNQNLKIIGFGASDKIQSQQDSVNLLLFLRSIVRNADGKEETEAVPIGWVARKWVELRSDVLDYEVSRRPKLPVRDYAMFVDEDDDDSSV